MLVLSRRPHERIIIPAINACIHVAAVQPGVVRVAINAPPEVAILRGELVDRAAEWAPPATARPTPAVKPRRSRRRTHARLRGACMALGLARLQLRAGLTRNAEAALARVHLEIQALRRRLDAKAAKAPRTADNRGPQALASCAR